MSSAVRSQGPQPSPRLADRVAAVARVAWGAEELSWARRCAALFVSALVAHLAGAPAWIVAPLAAAAYAAGGWKPAREGLLALRERRIDVDALMVLAAIAAAAVGQWIDGGLLIVIFATSGGLEELATARTEGGVRSLLDLAPPEAVRVAEDGSERRVDAAELDVGHMVLARPGDRIPADGTVRDGRSDVDEASITGEPLPAAKAPGAEVFAGTLNIGGALTIEVARPAADSVVARIVRQVEEAAAAKAPTQLLVERFEQRYSTTVVVATLALVAVPVLLGQAFEPALVRAMTFLIVASPCAVVLATMPPLLSAIATASRHGVLVKGGVAMERLGAVDTVAFDKTGTLTSGAPRLVDVHPVGGWTADDLLRLAAGAETGSEHPIGEAIVRAARERGAELATASAFAAQPGRGVVAEVDGHTVRAGNAALVDRGAALADLEAVEDREGRTAVLVEIDGHPAGVIGIADSLRHGSGLVVERLASVGVPRVLLVTGDRQAAATPVAAACGVEEVRSGLLPADKAAAIRSLQLEGHQVLVLGDGINDAPALAAAELGAAMGRQGADVALETADVVLVTDVVTRLPAVIGLAKYANRVVRQNLTLAGVAIAVLVALTLTDRLPLPIGVLLHEGSTLLVALNGLRLLRDARWPAKRSCRRRDPASTPALRPATG